MYWIEFWGWKLKVKLLYHNSGRYHKAERQRESGGDRKRRMNSFFRNEPLPAIIVLIHS
jgi:hypothetical protein